MLCEIYIHTHTHTHTHTIMITIQMVLTESVTFIEQHNLEDKTRQK